MDPNLAELQPVAGDVNIEIVGRMVIDEIVKEGIVSAETLESAMFTLTEWLTDLDVQPGDELVVIRRKETV